MLSLVSGLVTCSIRWIRPASAELVILCKLQSKDRTEIQRRLYRFESCRCCTSWGKRARLENLKGKGTPRFTSVVNRKTSASCFTRSEALFLIHFIFFLLLRSIQTLRRITYPPPCFSYLKLYSLTFSLLFVFRDCHKEISLVILWQEWWFGGEEWSRVEFVTRVRPVRYLALYHWDLGTKARLFDSISGQRTSGEPGWSISFSLWCRNRSDITQFFLPHLSPNMTRNSSWTVRILLWSACIVSWLTRDWYSQLL